MPAPSSKSRVTAKEPADHPADQGPTDREVPAAANASPSDPPTCYLTKRVINGGPYAILRLTIEAYERVIDSMVARRLLDRSDLDKRWVVTSALFADLFDDYTVDWLRRCRRLSGWRR